MKNLKNISPDYPRIPHLAKDISNMTHDDIVVETDIAFPITGYVQEKIDGSNMGISWFNDGPVLRNREHILQKGYIKRNTPAKLQFRPAWNFIHEHEDDIKFVSEKCMSPVTIYGELMIARHSIEYNNLTDWFIAYDIYSVEDRRFLAPNVVEDLLSKTGIKYIKPYKVTFNNIQEVVEYSERPSDYTNGIREGIVIKISDDDKFVTQSFKIVNKYFVRREDFNELGIIKNRIIK
jgi:hypothetical protein